MSAETRAIVDAAEATLRQIIRERDRDIELAKREVEARHAEAIEVARHALHAATSAHRASEDVLAAHPWEGKRVYRMERVHGVYWSSRPVPSVRVEGIFEVYRSNTLLPETWSKWRMPEIGQCLVRLAKKDGKPGKKIELISVIDKNNAGWLLVEEETPHVDDAV